MDIRPFQGWRYAAADVSGLISPPYDILSDDDKAAMLATCDRNVVAVDMPFYPPGSAGPDDIYQGAADALTQWRQDGTLVVDDARAVYAYAQSYTWGGKPFTRRAMIAGVRATPLGQDVIPHEHTFAGPKADRMKLMQFTRKHLSPIFGFFDDANGAAKALWAAVADRPPDAAGQLGDVREELWVVTEPSVIESIQTALADVPVFIADGHHRYTTSMDYARQLREAGSIGADHEANFVMFALVPSNDPGLVILPTHRVVRGLAGGFAIEEWVAALGHAFEARKLDSVDDPDAFLAGAVPGTLLALTGDHAWSLRLTDPSAMAAAAPQQSDAWRSLDVAVLQTLIIDGALADWMGKDTDIRYTPDGVKAVEDCRSAAADLALCLQATQLYQVQAIALAGESMPHKSTYFYPKLATGMVIKPLE